MSAASFEFVEDVTSDLCFRARGGSPEAVFGAAAEALLAATVEDPSTVGVAPESRRIEIEEPDLELLLLRFLNELVYWRDAEGLLLRPRRLAIARDGAARLEAELVGERWDRRKHRPYAEVKAATAHGLRVGPTPDGVGWEARVTLDV